MGWLDRFKKQNNKANYSSTLTMAIDDDPIVANDFLNAFIGRFLFSATKNGINSKYNLNVNASAKDTSSGEVNLLNYLTDQLVDSSSPTIEVRLWYKTFDIKTVDKTTLKSEVVNKEVRWFDVKPDESASDVVVSLNTALITTLGGLFMLKAVTFKGMLVLSVAGSTVNFKISLEGLTANQKVTIEEQIKVMKNGALGKLGAAIYMDSNSSLEMVNINADYLLKMQDVIDKAISTISGVPLSFVNGENLHQIGGDGGVELLAYDDFLETVFNRYIYPVISFVDKAAARIPNEYIIKMKIDNLLELLEALDNRLTSLVQAYAGVGNVPKDQLTPVLDSMKRINKRVDALLNLVVA